MDIPDVFGNPIVIWAAILMVVSGYIATVSEKLQTALGPLGRWLGERKMRKLKRVDEYNDARVDYLTDQVEFLADEVAKIRESQRVHSMLLVEHQSWDTKVAAQIQELGGVVEPPPPLYPGYARGAKAAGIFAGGYHYAQFGDPVAQTNLLVDRCVATGATDLAPCLDLEDPFGANVHAADFAVRFLRQVKARGFRPCLYANQSMMQAVQSRVLAEVPDTYMWVARYAGNTSTVKLRPTVRWDLHQYSHYGLVNGIVGRVDLNDGVIPLNDAESAAKPVKRDAASIAYSEEFPMRMPKGGKLKKGGAKRLRWETVTVPSVLREHDLVIGSDDGVHIEAVHTWKYIHKGQMEARWGKHNKRPGGVGNLLKKAWIHEMAGGSVVIPKGVAVLKIGYATEGDWSLSISPRKL